MLVLFTEVLTWPSSPEYLTPPPLFTIINGVYLEMVDILLAELLVNDLMESKYSTGTC